MLGLRACLLVLGLATAWAESGTWHFVDVTQVVCPGSPGEVTVEFPLEAMNESARYQPHVLTVYRISLEAVNLSYRLTDSAQPTNHTIDDRTVNLRALSNSSRRLRAVEVAEEADEREDEEQEDEVEEELSTKRRPRMLSGKSGGSRRRMAPMSPRRRTPPTSPRRRSAPVSSPRRRSAPVSSPRRRSSPNYAARRRGAPAEPGSRRRTYGAGGSRWGNSQDPRAGHYGYTNQAALNNNFGGRPPVTTPYGYSGANAYRPSSGASIAMAVGGGLLAGTMGAYLLHRWSQHNLRSQPCTSITGQHYATCEECRMANPGSQCVAGFGLPVSAARDDLMTTGFVPADVTGPLRLRISQVQGADFLPQTVCPPAGWNPNASVANDSNASLGNVSWAPSSRQAIFVTLTRVEALGDPSAEGADAGPGGVGALWPTLAAAFCGCLLLSCIGAACVRKRQAPW